MTTEQPMRIILLSLLMCVVVGCGSEDASQDPPSGTQPAPERIAAENNPELAAQAAQGSVVQMLALAKDGAWEAYIQAYYGELNKIENDDQLQQLQDRFAGGWGEKLIPVLEQASEITPVIEDNKALFKAEGNTIFELHLGDDGRWKFHL
ncbi:MAG: hypothetical protein ACPG4Q_00935 [Phycisphaeraceae bacterium]